MSVLSALVLTALGVLLGVRALQSSLVIRGIARLPGGANLEPMDESLVLGSTLSHRPLTAVLFVPGKEDSRAALESIRSVEETGYPGIEILVLAQRPNDLSEIRDHFGLRDAEPVIVKADSGHRYEQWTAESSARVRLIRGPFRDSESLALTFSSWAGLFPLLLWLAPGVTVSRTTLLRLGATLERDRGVAAVVGSTTASASSTRLERIRSWWSELRNLEFYGLLSEACALALPASIVLFRRSALVDAEVFDRGEAARIADVLRRLVESRSLGATEWRLAASPHASGQWSRTPSPAATSGAGLLGPTEHGALQDGLLPADWSWLVRFYARIRGPWLHRYELLVAVLVVFQAATGTLPMAGALVALMLLLLLPALLSTLANVWEQLVTSSIRREELVETPDAK